MQYELVAVVDPKLDEKKASEKLTTLLAKEGFIVSDTDVWGVRELAYSIKKCEQGLYLTLTISCDSSKNPGLLYNIFKMDDSILRTLVLRKERNKTQKSKVKTQN